MVSQNVKGLVIGLLLSWFVIFTVLLTGYFMGFGNLWRKLRVIAVAIPLGNDPQAVRRKLIEAIRSRKYRENAEGGSCVRFSPPPFDRRVCGTPDIVIVPDAPGSILVTGPAGDIADVERIFVGVTPRRYTGRQPIWPMVLGAFTASAILMAFVLAVALMAYLAGA
jgi:hypothetical protein